MSRALKHRNTETSTELGAFSRVKYRSGNHPSWSHLGVVLLMALFIFCLLACCFTGTSLYRVIYQQQESQQANQTLNLLSNIVKADDATRCIGTGKGPEGDSLVLIERLETGTFETRIYLHRGNLVQEYAKEGSPYLPDSATTIGATSAFSFAYERGVLSMTVDQGTARVALRSMEKGGGK